MTTAVPAAMSPTSSRARFTPAVLLLFVGSGCAALIYEVVWFHLLRLVVGGSAVSLGFLLGSFMGGMCIGSLLLPRLLARHRHPLRVYALLELGIAGCGLAMPYLLPALGRFYAQVAGGAADSLVWRGAVCALALLPPTILMGATLPAIARWMDTSRRGIASMGMFYGANLVGAVAGTLLAGFYLLRVHDTIVATQVAAVINVAIALVALAIVGREKFVPSDPPAGEVQQARLHRVVYLTIALSGLTALGAQVVWTRLLSLLFGASVYTFSLILAVFLVGLGIGSTWGARLAGRTDRPGRWLAACQLLLVPALLYSAFLITKVIPYGEPTYVFQPIVYENMALRYPWDFLRCALAILPGPILWGASFPLALAAAGVGHRDAGRLVGGVSAANTVGCIVGALGVSLSVPLLGGMQHVQQWLVLMAGATGVLALACAPTPRPGSWARARVLLLCVPLLAVVPALAYVLPAIPDGMIGYGRTFKEWNAPVEYLYRAEGVSASVAVTREVEELSFHVSGKVVASTTRIDMRLQRMLGHLPALIHGNVRNVLIVGCGAAVTAGSFVDHPGIERIVVCEIEPKVIEGAREFLRVANRGVLDDPRTEVVLDDARHFLAQTREKFDIITSDPIHPWVRGAAALYSAEYYEIVKQHLAPGGIVTQWVPLYQTDEASVKSQIGTFFHAFPEGSIWNSDLEEVGYDVVLMARVGPMVIDVDAIDERLEDLAAVRQSLEDVDLGTAVRLLSTFSGRAIDLRPWLADAQLNEDLGLKLQYLAGLRLDLYRDHEIYAAMKTYFRYPDGLFRVSEGLEHDLRQALAK